MNTTEATAAVALTSLPTLGFAPLDTTSTLDDAPRGELAFVASGVDAAGVPGVDIFSIDVAEPERAAHPVTDSGFTLRDIRDLAYSPDGASLAWIAEYPSGDTQVRRLMLADADGANAHMLLEETNAVDTDSLIQFDWFPDSQHIATAMLKQQDTIAYDTDLVLVDVGSGDSQTLDSPVDIGENDPDISPDGTQLVFRCLDLQTGRLNICSRDVAGSDLTTLTNADTLPSANAYGPRWLSDGSIIFYNWDAERSMALLLQIADGSISERAHDLAQFAPFAASAATDVLFQLTQGEGETALFVVSLLDTASDSGVVELQGRPENASFTWSPDNRYFAVSYSDAITLFRRSSVPNGYPAFTPHSEALGALTLSPDAMSWRLP